MAPSKPGDRNPTLLELAREVCGESGIDFDSLDHRQTRGILNYWCLFCHRTFPLTDLKIEKKCKVCSHCNNTVTLRGASNKFGDIRRAVFFRRLSRQQ